MNSTGLDSADTLPAPPAFKTCTCCGREHTLEAWSELDPLGLMGEGEEEDPVIELRNCLCGTTLGIEK